MKKLVLLLLVGITFAAISCSNGSSDATVESDPEFAYIADAWDPTVFSLDMSDYWQAHGITHTGKNYYLFSNPAEGNCYSERFNPASKYFQSWIGIYTVDDKNGVTYGITDGVLDKDAVIRLGIADQTGWLRDFARITDPRVILDNTVPVTSEETTIDGVRGWKLTCRLHTQADVGTGNLQSGIPELIIVPADSWNTEMESYQEIMMNIVFYVWHSPENRELNMLYLTGAEYTDLHDTDHDHLPDLLPELEEMARNITVQ